MYKNKIKFRNLYKERNIVKIAKVIRKVLKTYNRVKNTILHCALYLQPLKKYGTIFKNFKFVFSLQFIEKKI